MTTTPQAALLSRMHWLREETRRISNVTLAGECVVFEHDEETTVLLGDYTLGSFE